MKQERTSPPLWTAILIMTGGAIGAFAFLLVFAFWSGSPVQDALIEAHGAIIIQPSDALDEHQTEHMLSLMKGGALLSADQFLDHTVSFYEQMINLLVTLLMLVAGAAYLYIKAISDDFAKQQAQKYALEMLENTKFRDQVEEYLKPYATSLKAAEEAQLALEDFQSIPNFEERLKSQEEQIKVISEILATQDKSEDTDAAVIEMQQN